MNSSQVDLSGKRVLVTGGTGGIGGRLVEKLVLECGADVNVLVRNLTRAPRITRLPVDIIQGDVMNLSDVNRAISGCDVVFHCAYGNSGDREQKRIANVDGTRNVMEACLHAGIKRIVHVSTCRVFGVVTPDEDLDESAPRKYSNNPYTDSKLDAENIVFEYVEKRGLPVSVIQPTTVYGPFVPVWTLRVMERVKTGRTILVNGGNGICNAVYVDDVVNGMLLAAVREEAVGEAFLISGESPITWHEFYDGFTQMVAGAGTVNMSVEEAKAYSVKQKKRQKCNSVFREPIRILRDDKEIRKRIRNTCEVSALIRTAKFILPEGIQQYLKKRNQMPEGTTRVGDVYNREMPIHVLTPQEIAYFAAKTRFRIDKAKQLLGYQPAFDFQLGMQITEAWARWSNLAHK